MADSTEQKIEPEQTPPSIAVAMGRVLADVPAVGKNSKAPSNMGGYDFRGIEDVTAALKPALAKHGVFCIPNVKERVLGERPVSGNKTMFVVDLFIEWTFYGPAGDSLTATCWGQGTDMGDKSHQKAMTSGFKSMLMQTFCIGDSGEDAEAHSVPEAERRTQDTHSEAKAAGWADAASEAAAHKAASEQIKQLFTLITDDHPARAEIKQYREDHGWPMAANDLLNLSMMVAKLHGEASASAGQEQAPAAEAPKGQPKAPAPAPAAPSASPAPSEGGQPWDNLPEAPKSTAKPLCPWCEKEVIGPSVITGGTRADDPAVRWHKACYEEQQQENQPAEEQG